MLDSFQGERCQQKINHCLAEPCQHGGTCFDRFGSYVCQCSGGFSGTDCELEVSSRVISIQSSTCIFIYLDCLYVCQQMLVEPTAVTCETDSCLNGGICSSRLNDIECLCATGFTGPRCQINIDDCLNVTCPANSHCVDGIDSHQCVCLSGFTGTALSGCLNIDECQSNPCQNNGTCTDMINGFDCECPPGFGGDDCSVEIDECQPSPCLNGATCVDTVANYTCLCADGFQGRDCQVDVDECASSPCVHSTTCTDLVGDYRCVCEPGWTGRHCDVDVDECADNPCSNNATCLNELNAFQCQCLNGFLGIFHFSSIQFVFPKRELTYRLFCCRIFSLGLGDRCEINRDDCLPNLCRNNGTCVDQVANYTCVCPPEFMGRHCEEEFDACASSPCQNGASCITTRPQSNFYCECLPGIISNSKFL